MKNKQEVRDRAFAMPITNPAYPRPPVRFVDREIILITYRFFIINKDQDLFSSL